MAPTVTIHDVSIPFAEPPIQDVVVEWEYPESLRALAFQGGTIDLEEMYSEAVAKGVTLAMQVVQPVHPKK